MQNVIKPKRFVTKMLALICKSYTAFPYNKQIDTKIELENTQWSFHKITQNHFKISSHYFKFHWWRNIYKSYVDGWIIFLFFHKIVYQSTLQHLNIRGQLLKYKIVKILHTVIHSILGQPLADRKFNGSPFSFVAIVANFKCHLTFLSILVTLK